MKIARNGLLALAEYFRERPQPVGLRFELYTNEETSLRWSANCHTARRRAYREYAREDDAGLQIDRIFIAPFVRGSEDDSR